METLVSKNDIINAISSAFRELESQKYALDQSAIVAITDVKGNIIYVNEQFCQISKYSAEELMGKNHRIINSGLHPPEFFQEMWRTIASGNVWKSEIRNKAKDGSYYWVYTTITPFLNENSVPTMFVSIRFDITAQKLMEKELEDKLLEREKMLNALSHKNKQLEDFCHIISHNLRAPLSNLSLMIELLNDSDNESEKRELLGKFKHVTDYLQETFDELVSAIQIRQIHLDPNETVSLSDSVEKIKQLQEGNINECDALITTDFSQIDRIKYSKKYIESILLNVIGNSIKYRSPERRLEVKIESFNQNGKVGLSITDNGLGLDTEKNKEKLFKMRQTFHEHPNARGFGLFMVKSQIESLGGTIEAEGKLGEGLKITMNLY